MNRFSKAAAVIVIVGFGFFQNLDNHSFYSNHIQIFNSELDNNIITNDSVQNNSNQFIIYTKSLIKSSVEHLISNL